MKTFGATSCIFLFALTSNAFIIHDDDNTGSQSKQLEESVTRHLKSVRKAVEREQIVAKDIYRTLLNNIVTFDTENSDAIWNDLNIKRVKFHELRMSKRATGVSHCMELIGHLGHSATEAVVNINECAIEHSERTEEYFYHFDNMLNTRLELLHHFEIGAKTCFAGKNVTFTKSCLENTLQFSTDHQGQYSLAKNQLNTLSDTLETHLASCTSKIFNAYQLESSIFISEAEKCLQNKNARDHSIEV